MHIRAAKLSDAPRIAHIHVETWRTAYRGLISDSVLAALDVERRMVLWRELITKDSLGVWVAELDGIVGGFCNLICTRDRDSDPKTVAEIAAIYVAPENWRKGMGRALVQRALKEARKRKFSVVTLWTLASNAPARHFYEATGFELDGATKIDKASDSSELHEVRFRRAL